MNDQATAKLRSRTEITEQFELEGKTVQAWAAQNNFRPANVYAVLTGRCKCRRGEGHRIAVKLGLKPQIGDVLFEEVVSDKLSEVSE
jgi:gp16 family phage-associated protein